MVIISGLTNKLKLSLMASVRSSLNLQRKSLFSVYIWLNTNILSVHSWIQLDTVAYMPDSGWVSAEVNTVISVYNLYPKAITLGTVLTNKKPAHKAICSNVMYSWYRPLGSKLTYFYPTGTEVKRHGITLYVPQ